MLQVRPQEKIEERLRKRQHLLCSQGFATSSPALYAGSPGWWGGRRQDREEDLNHGFIGVFARKTRQGRGKSLGLTSWNNFSGLWTVQVVAWYLVPGRLRQRTIAIQSGWARQKLCGSGLGSVHIKERCLMGPLLSQRIASPRRSILLPAGMIFFKCQNIWVGGG